MVASGSMSGRRLVLLGGLAALCATVLSLIAWIAVLYAGLGGICGDSTTEAECGARQSGAEVGMIFMGLLFGSLALFALFLVVRAAARPRGPKDRWYFAGTVLLFPMPTVSVLVPAVEMTPTNDWTIPLAAMATLGVAWTLVWCLLMRNLMSRAASASDQASGAEP